MRGKKYKKLLSWVLCACMIIGVIPSSSLAANTNQQSKTRVETQAKQERDNTAERAVVLSEQQTENSEDTSSEKESESKSNQKEDKDTSQEDDSESDAEKKDDTEKDTEEQEVTEEEDAEEETIEEAQEVTTESAEEEETEEDEDGIALQDLSSGNAAVVAVKLTENENNSVWGKGLITGSEDLDDKSWDKVSDENRGYDSSSSNDIIRSFDSINYNVSSTITMDREEHTLVYEVILPNDSEITLDTKKMNAKEVSSQENGDGTITYTCKYELKKGYAGGEKTENVIVKVGNKHQNDTVRPIIKAYLDENKDSALEVENMETVTVTTAPMYNIVLQKKKNESIVKEVYDFNQKNETGKTYFPDNAEKYKDNKVTGYKCTYGFALEIRKPGDGIKGVELPDPNRDFTFDIDLSKTTLKGKDDAKNLVENGFTPLLYYLGPNEPGGGAITEIPFTKQYTGNDLDGAGCLNSGNVSMTQEGTTLHVTVNGFKIDSSQFPKKNYSGTSYWEDINKIREGMFSSYLFQVVYPYINEDGDNLQTKLGNGTVNVAATVKNMNAFSEEGTRTTDETSLKDNEQTNTWDMTSGHGRNQQIFYSTRKSMINSYSPEQVRADGDIAAVGADNLAFTVSYVEKNIGEADERADLPVAIDQLVLFDRNAITNVEYSKYMQQSTAEDKYGYNCTVRYGVLKNGGHLDNESMRTAKMEDFTFYDTKPEGGSDAVLVQYRGTNLGSPDMMLHAQFNAEVKNDAELADNVYMVTAFTKVWTASDFAQEILEETKKESLSEVSRKEISDWGKKQDATGLVENKDLVQPVVDHRGYYTVPDYEDGVYKVDENHKFGIYSADALYIVPYTTTITKTVAQLDENGNPQQRYNIGQGQRYVDYKISNSIKYWGDVTPPEDATTTVYITDTVPDGLTYIKGSAYWDGSYTSKYPQQGSVTGGTQIEPEVVTENGKTILKWAIPKVMLKNGEIPSLYYSCKIGKDVADNANLQGDATIQTDEDKRPILKGNDNISNAAISVTRSNEFYIVKRGGASLELEDSSYYELVAANTSSDDKKDLCIFDTMPYAKGDKIANGSKQMKGQYKITALTMDAEEVEHASDMEIWYTSNEDYIGKTAKDISPEEVTESNGWKKATASGHAGSTITFTGKGLIGDWPTVIAYKDANLEKNTIATLRLEYETPAGAENDEFTNAWSTMSNEKELKSEAKTDVYKRTLEGTVWFDKDQDGKIDEDESKIEGVKVTLYVKNDKGDYVKYTPYNETVEDETYKSKNAVTYTDENGHYKFTGLPSGDYRVTFESSDGTDLGHYDVTKANADEDKTVTSKVEKKNVRKNGDGELTSGTITDITMPTIEEMDKKGIKSYNLPDQNLGLTIPTVDISGTKIWKDANNQDGKRPTTIKICLYADGKEVEEKEAEITVDEDNSNRWNWKFTGLPKYSEEDLKQLTEIKYTVKEEEVKDYTSKVTGDASTGYVITNTHTPEVTSVKGSKTWDDADDQDGKRPEKITVRLLANGKEVANKEVTADEKQNWSWSFTNLPKYEGGKEIIYTVTEDSVKDYTTTVDGYNITNSYKPGKVSVGVTKAWDDVADQDGKRPESIKVHLYADGKDSGKELTLTEKENWSGSFTDLDEYKAGKKIEYTVKEEEVKDYTSKVTGDADKGYVITNTHTPEVTSVEGSKTWDDNDNQDGKRPEKITVRLLANGTEVASKEVTAANNWSWSFTNLPKNTAGKAIVYTVKEDKVEGYTSKVTGDASTGYVITNTHTPEVTSVKGSKTWDDADDQDGKRPEKITVRLLANGKEVANKEVTADEKQNWSWSFTNLPKYEGGKEIIYTVTEDSVKDYTTTVDGYNITNSYKPGKVSVGVTKTWDDATDQDGKRPESIKVHLYADGKDSGKELTLTEKENWSGSFTDLDEYKAGKKIEYTVKEAEVNDYTSKVTGDADKGYVVTNTHTPEVTSVEGKKTWDDNDNQDGKRPEKITVRLLANGTEVDSEEVTAANNWSWSFTDLPKYAEGAEIIYTVTEDAVENYTTTVDGYDITNSYTPGKVNVLVTKSWNDSNDQDGKRPESITIHLYADGEDTGETLEMTEENNWSGSFTDFDEYKDGVKITYTVEEDVPDGYTASITGDEVQGYVITNTHISKDKNDFPDKNLDDDGNDGDDGDTDDEELEESSNESESSSGKSNNSNRGLKQTRIGKSAKTGDTSAIAEWMIIFLVAGVIIIAFAYERRKSSK